MNIFTKVRLPLLALALAMVPLSQATAQRTTYCSSMSEDDTYEYISKVEMGDISNSSNASTYTDFTAISSDVLIGQTYSLNVTVSNFDSDNVSAWIDWNQNGTFDDNELVVLTPASRVEKLFSANVTVPVDAALGTTCIRVVLVWLYTPAACGSYSYGETEDYTLNVIGDGLHAQFSAAPNKVGVGENVVFTDKSIGAPTSWTWDFGSDGTPATATGQGPQTVSFGTLGMKSVSLTVSDGTNEDTKTITNCVEVIRGNAAYPMPQYVGVAANYNDVNISWYAPGESPALNNPESFESGLFPPAGWQLMKSSSISETPAPIASDDESWVLSNVSTYVSDGSYAAAISYGISDCNWLVTPDVPIDANKQLRFDLYFKNTSSYQSQFNVMVYADGAWASVYALNDASASNLLSSPVVVDLSAYSGKTVKIAFVQTYTDGYNIAVDNVNIEDKSRALVAHPIYAGRLPGKQVLLPQMDNSSKATDIDKTYIKSVRVNTATFAPFAVKKVAVLTGFNVFRDGNLITTLDASARNYTDQALAKGTYSYSVSAVYGSYESYATDPLSVETTNPVVTFSADKTATGISEPVVFTAEIMGTATTVEWNFGDGATPSTATGLGPHSVTYSTLGKKTVSVIVDGSVVATKTDYITVQPGSGDVPAPNALTAKADYNTVNLQWQAPGTVYKLNEGFEGATWPPSGWSVKYSTSLTGTQTDPTDLTKTWFHCDENSFGELIPDYIHSGSYSAGVSYEAPDFNWLISPEVVIENGDMLKFWVWYNNGTYQNVYYYTNFRVMVKADGSWNQALYYTDGTTSNNFDSEVTVDLSSYAGKTIQVAFVYEFTDGFELMVDDVSIISGTGSFSSDDFKQYNVYRNDQVVKNISDMATVTYTDENLETGRYKYYVTTVDKTDKESYPTNEAYVDAYKVIDIPYSQDFETSYNELIFNTGDYAYKVGTISDFNNASYTFPSHDGTFVGVNTSDISGSIFGYDEASDILTLPPLNLSEYGSVNVEFDYVADMPGFALIGRVHPDSTWTLIKQIPSVAAWSHFKTALPYNLLRDGYQLGIYYDNLQEASSGVAFDNLSVSALLGKHISLEYKGVTLDNNATQYLGMILPGTEKDYTITVRNIGTESVSLSDINFTGDGITITTNPQNTTIAPRESADVVLHFAPTEEKKYTGVLSISNDSDIDPFVLNLEADCGSAEWTYMIYLYEDGTGLDGLKDFNELEVAGSVSGAVNYIVLYDSDDDTKDGIYYVEKDPDGMNNTLVSQIVNTSFNAGLDMNKWQTLRDFMLWTKENYPAKHYGVTVWDHGSGIFKRSSQGAAMRNAVGNMKLWDLPKALQPFVDVDGQKLDIFGFDVCLLGQLETAFELRNYTDYIVFSEKTEPGDGWDYINTFSPLSADPSMAIGDFITNHVNGYAASYNVGGSQNSYSSPITSTQSGVSIQNITNDLIPALNAFADTLSSHMYQIKADVVTCINNSWESGDGADYAEQKDLGGFLSLIEANAGMPQTVKDAAIAAHAAYDQAVIRNGITSDLDPAEVTGMKIWLPTAISTESNKVYYLDNANYLDFSLTRWDEMLKMLENPIAPAIPVAAFNASDIYVYTGQTVMLNDETVANPVISYREWAVTPSANVEFVNGTTNASANAAVKFTAAGTYSVRLIVENSMGRDTVTAENYIVVVDPVFDAPSSLTAAVNGANVTLNWMKPGDDLSLSEGFEDGVMPSTWSVMASSTLTGAQSAPADPAKSFKVVEASNFTTNGEQYIHSGVYAAYIAYSAPNFNWLISPEVNVVAGDQLNFWVWYNNGEDNTSTYYYTNFRVMVYADGVWNQALYYTDGADPNLYSSAVVVDLNSYAGKAVKVAFVYEYTNGWQLAIDDISITNSGRNRNVGSYVSIPRLESGRTQNRVGSVEPSRGDGTVVGYVVYKDNQELTVVNGFDHNSYVDQNVTSGSHTYKVALRYTNPDGESAPSNEVTVTVTGIEENTASDIRIAPNPNNGSFRILVGTAQPLSWSLMTLTGAVVKTGNFDNNHPVIDGLRAGVYMLVIQTNTGKVVRKVIVH